MLLEIIPIFSSCLISWSTNSLYFSGTMHGFEALGGPSVGISMAVRDMMLAYLMSSTSFSLSLASSGISASGIDLDKLLASGSNCRLVLLGILGNNLAVLSCSLVQLVWLVWLLANCSKATSGVISIH